MNTFVNRRGVLLVGHGTRDAVGRHEFLRTAELVRQRLPEAIVEPCFLELARPNIAEGLDSMLQQGVEEITVAPLLLLAAAHAKQDVPRAVQQAIAAHASAARPILRQAPPLGCEPSLLQLSATRYQQALRTAGATNKDCSQARLLLLGRGSGDPTATQEMHQFAELRIQLTPVAKLVVGFLAMASPDFEESAALVSQGAPPLVVVQPHLLFAGALVDRVATMVDRISARSPHTRWVLARPLGPEPLLADALVARIREPQRVRLLE